jgi:hydroxyacylglutathione hydrolase
MPENDVVHGGSVEVHTISLGIAQAYLIAGFAGTCLVDAGMARQEKQILKAMQAFGHDDLKLIFITHAHLDHYGSAATLREITGAEIAIHHADADAMARGDTILGECRGRGKIVGPFLPFAEFLLGTDPTPADILLEDGDTLESWGIDARVLHTPGHTAGSSCLLVESRVAFVGDLLSGGIHPHAQRYYADDWSQIPTSIARLREQNPEMVYAGHGSRPVSAEQLKNL